MAGSALAGGDPTLTGQRVEADDSVGMYLKEIGRYPLLTAQEEVALAIAIEAGRLAEAALAEAGLAAAELADAELAGQPSRRELQAQVSAGEQAQVRFVRSNLRLVVSIAKRQPAPGLALLDLVQEGNIGLMRAVESFDWRRGFRFSTYATWWIRQAITRAVANTGRTIRLPAGICERLTGLRIATACFEADRGRPPSDPELALTMGMHLKALKQLVLWSKAPRSLAEPMGDDDAGELGDLIEDATAVSPAEAVLTGSMAADLAVLLERLSPRSRGVLRLRYGLDGGDCRTLEAVGQHYNVSRERIRQIEQAALEVLRAHPAASPSPRPGLPFAS